MPSTDQNKTNKGIAIAGMGIISALGNTLEENRESLLQNRPGVGSIRHIDTLHANDIQVGEVSLSNTEMASILGLPEEHNFTRTALLGSIAALEALKLSQLKFVDSLRVGLISATTVGGMDMTERYFKSFDKELQTRKYIDSHPAGDSTDKIADLLKINGLVTTVSTACSSAANAMMLGARLIRSGRVDAIIVGGTDALSRFTINGFKSLMILSDQACTPFDESRQGLNLGEGAAYLVLVSDETLKGQKLKPLAYLSGWGNANDAHHQTASSETGTGAYRAMETALRSASITPEAIGYVNAHGTATRNNDLSESRAMQGLFSEKIPPFSSTKPFTGHTLAAAGAVEAVFSIIAIREQLLLPNLHFKTSMSETGLEPQMTLEKRQLTHVLSNSFGFGGNCSTLIFSRS